MFINVPAQSTQDPDRYEVPEHYESANKHGQAQIYTQLLRKMYKRYLRNSSYSASVNNVV